MKTILSLAITILISLNSMAQQVKIPFKVSNSDMMTVKAILNGKYQREFDWDTGATTTTIPESLFQTLYRAGEVKDNDIVGEGEVILADGNKCDIISLRLKSLTIGNYYYPDCIVDVIIGAPGSFLIGQNVIKQLGTILVDPKKNIIFCEGVKVPANIQSQPPVQLADIELEEVRVIPCSSKSNEVNAVRTILANASFKIKKVSEETNPIPQKAVDRVYGDYTVRYFDNNDLDLANQIEKMLKENVNGEILIENMNPYYNSPKSRYIEIWIK